MDCQISNGKNRINSVSREWFDELETIDWELDRLNRQSIQGDLKQFMIEVFRKDWHLYALPLHRDSEARNKSKKFICHAILQVGSFALRLTWKN